MQTTHLYLLILIIYIITTSIRNFKSRLYLLSYYICFQLDRMYLSCLMFKYWYIFLQAVGSGGAGEEANVIAKHANAVRNKDDTTKNFLASGILKRVVWYLEEGGVVL